MVQGPLFLKVRGPLFLKVRGPLFLKVRVQVLVRFIKYAYLELTWYLYHYLILFSQKKYKKEAQMFYQNHSLLLHTVAVEIFCKPILRNHWTWTWKILDCLTGLELTLLDMDSKSTWTALLDQTNFMIYWS